MYNNVTDHVSFAITVVNVESKTQILIYRLKQAENMHNYTFSAVRPKIWISNTCDKDTYVMKAGYFTAFLQLQW